MCPTRYSTTLLDGVERQTLRCIAAQSHATLIRRPSKHSKGNRRVEKPVGDRVLCRSKSKLQVCASVTWAGTWQGEGPDQKGTLGADRSVCRARTGIVHHFPNKSGDIGSDNDSSLGATPSSEQQVSKPVGSKGPQESESKRK
jgi:hypothetical protein